MNFNDEYAKLNAAQKSAVDQIEGPLLVVAGPGTGKTQLLSARVAKILQETDTLPQSILCLTFTEAAAHNIRERLASFIGKDAYDVQINTYHAFGSEIIANNYEYFSEFRLERPIDDLGKRQVLTEIVNDLPFKDPLKSTQYHLGDLMGTISELKRALLSPKKLRSLAQKNTAEIEQLNPLIASITASIKTFPSSLAKAEPLYAEILKALHGQSSTEQSLAALAASDLERAFEAAQEAGKSTPLTKWKNAWLHKNSDGSFVFTDPAKTSKLTSLATVLEKYNQALKSQGLYDFDDMIRKAIEAMSENPELKFNLQERYLYILLDEFQDTNSAQFKLVELLTDNPVNEGRPNVMAVGDDDQAIYAFQGAQSSNMIDFAESFNNTQVVNLTENYRSHVDILSTAQNVAEQIDSRLHNSLEGVEKTLVAKAAPKISNVARHDFIGPSEEYAWITTQIKKLLAEGVPHEEIAVLAPKHKFLENLVPFLNDEKIPVAYEKRENILHTPIIIQLQSMAQLLAMISANDTAKVNELLPRVLSLPAFDIPVQEIWKINWAHASSSSDASWAETATSSKALKKYVWFFHGLAQKQGTMTLESVLDTLIGSEELAINGEESATSPLKDFYFSPQAREKNPLLYFETLSHLSVIREKLREYQTAQENQLTIHDFLGFIQLYEEAEQPLVNTHPVAQAPHAVHLMTAYKAKGLEFEHVFIVASTDEVWGSRARNNSNKLSLPANLQHIRYAGANEDERLRLLFVALTRAKQGLVMTAHRTADSGRQTTPLKYFDEREADGQTISAVLPEDSQIVSLTEQESRAAKQASIELGWHAPHVMLSPELRDLLSGRLENYQMSPTHLNTFIDLEYGGPEAFLLGTILRFPHAPNPDGEFGNAIHQTLQWYQYRVNKDDRPTTLEVVEQFQEFLSRRYLSDNLRDQYGERGEIALKRYLEDRANMFQKGDHSELSFKKEGVFVGDAHMSGLIDRLEVNENEKTVRIVDFKTGKPSSKWHSNTKLLKYKQQLYMYQLLVEGSHTYKAYHVEDCRLEFVEPDESGLTADPLVLEFKQEELNDLKRLIEVFWHQVTTLDFADAASYPATYGGSREFIRALTSSS